MASLVLGVIGYAVAGPMGWSIGSTLGGMLTASQMKGQNITQEGGRLTDLRVQASTLGGAIPIFYGSVRVAGNMIWSKPILETKHVTTETTSRGGKGGGSGGETTVTTITYTYSQTFAVALGEGPILGVRKIWASGELFYNADSAADAGTFIQSNKVASGFALYVGTESQTPDPTIQADVGAANCPAYRGLAYVVFSDLQLAKYGNRTPNLEFEVVTQGVIETWNKRVLS